MGFRDLTNDLFSESGTKMFRKFLKERVQTDGRKKQEGRKTEKFDEYLWLMKYYLGSQFES